MSPVSSELTPGFMLQRDVQKAVQALINEAKEQVIREAVEIFTARTRKIVGELAVNVANYYSVERMGPDLVIKVRIEAPPPEPV